MTTATSYRNLVGGDWASAASGETMEVLNPATEETIAHVPRSAAADVDAAVSAASDALPAWLDTTPAERAEILLSLVSLTGDVETGKTIARNAADTLKRVHLELGGKAPVVVFDDADPAAVAEGIKIGGYWNSGQDCTAASRVVAGPKVYDRLLEELVPAVESLRVGDPAEGDGIEMGPVISKSQQERVLGFLERASGKHVMAKLD